MKELKLPQVEYPTAPDWLVGPQDPFQRDWTTRYPPLPLAYSPKPEPAQDPRGVILELCLSSPEDLLVPSPDQMEALLKLLQIIQNAPKSRVTVLTVQGRGGTGKSTMSRLFIALVEWMGWHTRQVAPMGKAAANLTRINGKVCATIHSALYGKPVEKALCPECLGWSEHYADKGACACGYTGPSAETKLIFDKAGQEDPVVLSGEVLIVEEAAMVHKDLGADLLAACQPGSVIVGIGDYNQNFPIAKGQEDPEGTRFFNLCEPTVELTQVHRQAESSEILAWCTALAERQSRDPKSFQRPPNSKGEVRLLSKYDAQRDMNLAAKWRARTVGTGDPESAMLITYTNEDRHELNRKIRKYLKRDTTPLAVGEFVIGRTNQRGLLLNGETAVVKYVRRSWVLTTGDTYAWCTFESYGGRTFRAGVLLDALGNASWREWRYKAVDRNRVVVQAREGCKRLKLSEEDMLSHHESRKSCPPAMLRCDYAYCITGRVSQGSEYLKVCIYLGRSFYGMWHHDELAGRRWLYTAVSRARRRLVVLG